MEDWPYRKGQPEASVEKYPLPKPEDRTPVEQKIQEAREQGQAYYVHELVGEELIEHFRRIQERIQPDEGLEEILRVRPGVFTRVFFSRGYLRLLTNDRLSEADLAVTKRFADVFDFAYARFLELQEKEERNRELEIENALERVRGKAQGMQESKDLWEVSKALSEEFKRLEIPHVLSSITIMDEERDAIEWWPIYDRLGDRIRIQAEMKMAMDEGLPFLTASLKTLWEIDPLLIESSKARERGEIFYTFEESREEMIERRQRTFPLWTLPNGRKISDVVDPEQAHDRIQERTIDHYIFNDHEMLQLDTEEALSDTNIAVAKRFSDLFGVAYGRYLELQEKEARNRELEATNRAMSEANKKLFQANLDLQREQVLERLRGQAQGMQSSGDIKPVVEAVYRELKGLGLSLTTSAIIVAISETGQEVWFADQDGHALEPVILEHSLANSVIKTRLRGDDYFHSYREGEEVKENFRQRIEEGYPQWKDVPEDRWPQKHNGYYVFFGGGNVYVSSEEPIAEEYLLLIKRFGEVFGFAHSRYKELQQKEAQNRRLAVDACVQRLRAEVQSMDEASDFEHILSLLTEGLKTVELSFDGCEIDVQDEPVENPTMELFEGKGFRYTTYTLDPNGRVASDAFALAAPFPTVNRRTIERFIAGEPWQGTSEGDAIVEVPAGSYGRLRLTATGRDRFTDEEVATLREFADAVALGYARYLDIRQIQEHTQRKSAFLASMSHELRTPMNAIKGFTNLVLRRSGDALPDQQRQNLEKVTQASDHLLAMINDILDLSKIEAGRMDVNPEPFDMKTLVTYCCATVSPLLEEKPDVKLEQDVADGIEKANTDQGRIRQMLINLLSNAIKFTDTGSVTVRAKQDDGQLVLSVSDTGQGIPDDEVLTIFDEYRQVEGSDKEHKGTGLGLSITKQFAELLGGSIGVESQAGKGSTFTVRVPMVYEEA